MTLADMTGQAPLSRPSTGAMLEVNDLRVHFPTDDGVVKAVDGIPATVLVFLLALLIKEVPLRGRATPGAEAAPAPEADALIG